MTLAMIMAASLVWRELPSLPVGLGGQYVGVVDDHLVVAGGSYWTASQWEGGKKTWVDSVYVLGRGDKQWRLAGRLPEPIGYGSTISVSDGMICLGGQTATAASSRVYRLRLKSGQVEVTRLGDLPEPMMMTGAAVLDGKIYIAGGQSMRALNGFYSMELAAEIPAWTKLPAWPGPPTFLPQMTTAGNSIYLVGGADLAPGRVFLKDAYEYTTGDGWRKIADYPHPVQAGVAASAGDAPLVFGGSDGMLAPFEAVVKDDHPGFNTMVWTYRRETNQWQPFGRMPVSLVTTGIVRWGDEWVIAGGEDRPGHRSPRVIAVRVNK